MPQVTYHIPGFSDYVRSKGIAGFEIAPKGRDDAFIAIKNLAGKRVAELMLDPGSGPHVTIVDRSAHVAIVAIATEYEAKHSGHVIRIRANYPEKDEEDNAK